MILQKQPKGAQQENQNKTRMVNNLIRLNPILGIKNRKKKKKQAEIHKTPNQGNLNHKITTRRKSFNQQQEANIRKNTNRPKHVSGKLHSIITVLMIRLQD